MSDRSTITIDCTGVGYVEVSRDVGEDIGGKKQIKEGKSFLIAQILIEVSKLLIDETEEDLKIGLIEARRGMKDV